MQKHIESQEIDVTQKVALFSLNFRQWTGTTVFRREDFQVGDNGRLPPAQVIRDLGSKNLIEPEVLKTFTTIKARARRILEETGIPFMTGWAVPIAIATAVKEKLDEQVSEYNLAKEAFLRDYDKKVEEWIRENPDFAEQLRQSGKTRADVETRIHAGYFIARVQPINNDESLRAEFASLPDRLLHEVSRCAKQLYDDSFESKDSVSQRSIGTLRRLKDKLDTLSFLDSGIMPIAQMINQCLTTLPTNGRLKGTAFWQLQGCVSLLSSVERMKRISNGELTLTEWKKHFTPVDTDTLDLGPMEEGGIVVADEPKPSTLESPTLGDASDTLMKPTPSVTKERKSTEALLASLKRRFSQTSKSDVDASNELTSPEALSQGVLDLPTLTLMGNSEATSEANSKAKVEVATPSKSVVQLTVDASPLAEGFVEGFNEADGVFMPNLESDNDVVPPAPPVALTTSEDDSCFF